MCEPQKKYQKQTDEQLVVSAKSGDALAMDELAQRMFSSVCFEVNRFGGSGIEQADLIQEGMIGFIQAVRTYDSQKNATFKTYANACIHHYLCSVTRRLTRKKQIPQDKIISLNNYIIETTVLSPEELVIEKERVSHLMASLNENLSVFEQQILISYLSGYSAAEIAEQLGINVKRISNALYRIRQKFHSLIQ